jgi:hypothetical protein
MPSRKLAWSLLLCLLATPAASAEVKKLAVPQAVLAWPQFAPCLQTQSDAALVIEETAEGHHFGSVKSEDAAYVGGACDYFVADITLPPGYKSPHGFIQVGGFMVGINDITNIDCDNYSAKLMIFEKTPRQAAQYTLKKSTGGTPGTFIAGKPSYCSLGVEQLRLKTPVTHAGVYRILVAARHGPLWKAVRAAWHWVY